MTIRQSKERNKVYSIPDQVFSGNEEQGVNAKVTREDWLNVAMDLLITDGAGEVKVMAIGDRLGVSRSSFYWYFNSRQDLFDALLDHWQGTNTAALIKHADMPATTITQAVCNVFRCFINSQLFNNDLDFAIRDWARRSGEVRRKLDQSDEKRVEALKAMFERFGYIPKEALTRARTLYFMQMGYNIAELNETMEDRISLIPEYLICFTGKCGSTAEIDELSTYYRHLENGNK